MKTLLLTLLALLCCGHAALAESADFDNRAFALLPVLHEGRVKPLDTYARVMLRDFSGNETIKGKDAPQWLADTLFDPSAAAETPVFRVNSQSLKEYLGLPKDKQRFALTNLAPVLHEHMKDIHDLQTAEPDRLTTEQNELIDLQGKVARFSDLLRSFSFLVPLNIEPPDQYQTGKPENTYLDFLPGEEKLRTETEALVKSKGADISKYNGREKTLALFAYALTEVRDGGLHSGGLKIIHDQDGWWTPWQFLLQQKGDIEPWKNMAIAYRAHDAALWLSATKAAQGPDGAAFRMHLEKAYNMANPFPTAMAFYLLGIILLAAEIKRKTNRKLFPLVCLGLGLLYHAGGIATRMFILQRPPVGTLYESLLFVSLVCALAAAVLYIRRKSSVTLFAGMGSAALLLFIAPFLLQKGESMEMLVAVLNTNLWLGTHVLCITSGYGVSILTAFLAHAYFILRLNDAPAEKLVLLQAGIYKISLVALLLTAIGTILGGIWADQSWGRFWGWDPKENGALLIVLWIIWMQHGRVSGQLPPLAFMASAAFLNVVVALAWFGVNLLSVGLHSYGFISGIAAALALFCLSETIAIATLWKLNAAKTTHNPA